MCECMYFLKLKNRIKKSLSVNKYKSVSSSKYYNKYSTLDILYISAYHIYRVHFCTFKFLINAQISAV